MNYLNKFGSYLNKGVNVVKQQIQNVQSGVGMNNNNNQNINYNINDLDNKNLVNNYNNNNNNQQQTKNTSISAFLNMSPNNTQNNNIYFNTNQRKNKNPSESFLKEFNLFHNEKIEEWDDQCKLNFNEKDYSCKVIITNFRLVIKPNFNVNKEVISNEEIIEDINNLIPNNYFDLPIHQIEKVEKIIKNNNNQINFNSQYTIMINMKDLREFKLIFNYGENENFFLILNSYIYFKETSDYLSYAIKYNDENPIYKNNKNINGWLLYDHYQEFSRQGLSKLSEEVNLDKNFRRTTLNYNYNLCPSYPRNLIVPGKLNDEIIQKASEFRTRNRIPTLSYFYYKSIGTIWRSSQPKSGIQNNRNSYDEELLSHIKNISPLKKLIIYDCRPYLAAQANRLKGAGFENIDNYPNSEIIFCNIDHIHSARNSLNKLYTLLKNPKLYEYNKYLSSLESSGWPDFIYLLIRAGLKVANSVKIGYSCLIHCSDGWDRASQLTAFSQLLIDPFYRTIKGYMILIEKDFLSFGHQFKIRNGYYKKTEYKDNQNSPILLQFLDATHQLLVNYPMYFEFNMKFLLFICNNINSGKYGTFLFNCEKEREEKMANGKTMSIWTEILNNIDKYKNPFYNKESINEYFFIPEFSIHKFRLWEEYFMQFYQLNIEINYDIYIKKYNNNNYQNLFGISNEKIVSMFDFFEKEKNEFNKEINKKNKEIEKYKNLIEELVIKNNLNKNLYDNLNEENVKTLNKFAENLGGNFNIDDDKLIFEKKDNENKIENENLMENLDENNNNEINNNKEDENEEKLD